MAQYTAVNLLTLFPAVLVGVLLWRQGRLSRALKISMIAPLLSFPWLYFGIKQKAWSHGNPGTLLMSVPLNEIALSFIMTFLNAGILILNYAAIIHEADRDSKPKNCTTQKDEGNPV
jgi:hypothetical protein